MYSIGQKKNSHAFKILNITNAVRILLYFCPTSLHNLVTLSVIKIKLKYVFDRTKFALHHPFLFYFGVGMLQFNNDRFNIYESKILYFVARPTYLQSSVDTMIFSPTSMNMGT